ncbi:MAG: hypothetical protein H6R13_2112 [Proteobacteria bacterium]|nr:hypothetical protein [Pseudomonadota bacterium]
MLLIHAPLGPSMKSDVYPVRSHWVITPDRKARSMKLVQGELTPGDNGGKQTRTRPALEPRRTGDVNEQDVREGIFKMLRKIST